MSISWMRKWRKSKSISKPEPQWDQEKMLAWSSSLGTYVSSPVCVSSWFLQKHIFSHSHWLCHFTVKLSFNLELLAFLLNVRMGSKPQKSFVSSMDNAPLLREVKRQVIQHLSQSPVKDSPSWGRGEYQGFSWLFVILFQNYFGVRREYLWHWQNVVLVLLKERAGNFLPLGF